MDSKSINAINNIFFKKHSRKVLISNINVTPLVDVMLVLLIIFMVTSPMLTLGVNINLPKASSSQPLSEQSEPLTISIDKNNNIYIFKTKISRTQLINKLEALTRTKDKFNTRIFIKADKDLPYGEIVNLLAEITSARFTKVALITDNYNETK
ncbi:protein TolR [Orientia chuto str. Dubai]|uniref:Protein TolR n=1 Tax=Orientia chuto str. Dubai TaxID=1359168 RepID=A0A0F3MME4_9RICK|nr:protein TolR [Candidatus Orientia mediorientalis]KJV56915.1 protein TolR [Orientia chuto str. Dubai]